MQVRQTDLLSHHALPHAGPAAALYWGVWRRTPGYCAGTLNRLSGGVSLFVCTHPRTEVLVVLTFARDKQNNVLPGRTRPSSSRAPVRARVLETKRGLTCAVHWPAHAQALLLASPALLADKAFVLAWEPFVGQIPGQTALFIGLCLSVRKFDFRFAAALVIACTILI